MLRKSANCVSVINPGVCECVCGGGEAGNNPPCVSSQALSASSHRYTAAAAAVADASGRKKPWSASPTDRERQRGRERERERRARRQGLVSVSGRWSLGQQGGIEVSRGVVVKLGYDMK